MVAVARFNVSSSQHHPPPINKFPSFQRANPNGYTKPADWNGLSISSLHYLLTSFRARIMHGSQSQPLLGAAPLQPMTIFFQLRSGPSYHARRRWYAWITMPG